MKKTRGLLMTISLALFSLLFVLISCSDDLGKAPTLDVYTGVIDIENVGSGESIQLKSTEQKQLELKITPNVGSTVEDYATITYSSSDKDIFTVSETGLIEGRQDGEAKLTIFAETDLTGNQIETVYTVAVSGQVKVQKLELDEKLTKGVILKEAGKLDLMKYIKVTPEDAFNTKLAFESSDDGIAYVKENILYAGSGGKAVITVKTTDGTNFKEIFNVEVMAPIKVWYDEERKNWEVMNSHPLVEDGNDSTKDPKELIDGNINSYMNMKKPGKHTVTPAGEILHFTVFTGDALKVNLIYFHHRNRGNQMASLRLWGFDLQGSNDNVNYKTLQTGLRIPNAEVDGDKTLEGIVELDKAHEYKYLRIICNYYNDTQSESIQIAELRLGYDESLDLQASQD